MDGQLSSIKALDIGQLVAIESYSKDSLLKAERISISHIMVGKIEKVDYSQNTLQILGQTIRYGSNTVRNADFKVHQVVIVRGNVDRAGIISARTIEYSTEDKILERGGGKYLPNLPESTSRNSNKKTTSSCWERKIT